MINRSSFLSPEKVVESFDLKIGDTVIDFGSGTGYWAIAMAKKVGINGEVFAIDNSEEKISVLKHRSQEAGVGNIKTVFSKINVKEIPVDRKADLILFSNLFSIISTDNELLKNAAKHAHKETKMVIIDWKIDSGMGPIKDLKVKEEDIIISARKAGFEFKHLLETGKHHFGMMFKYEGS